MFGRERRNAQAIEAMSAKLAAADARSRALSEAIAQIELRVAQDVAARERLQATTENVIATLEDSTLSNTADVARALGQVANLCATVAQRLESDQIERRCAYRGAVPTRALVNEPPGRTGPDDRRNRVRAAHRGGCRDLDRRG